MPDILIGRIEEILKRRGSWTTVADFMRQAAAEKADAVDREDRTEPDEVEREVIRTAKVNR